MCRFGGGKSDSVSAQTVAAIVASATQVSIAQASHACALPSI